MSRFTVNTRFRPGSGTWTLDYFNPEGRRRQLSGGKDEQQARRLAVKFTDWLMEGKDPETEIERARKVAERKQVTFGELIPTFLERYGKYQSQGQQRNYRAIIDNLKRCPQLIDCPAEELRKSMVLEYMRLRMEQHHVKASTVNHEADFISSVLNRAVEWDMLDRNPLQGMKRFKAAGKRDVYLSPEQLSSLINALPSRLADMAEFAAYTGFRLGNILTLRINHVRFHDLTKTGEADLVIKGGRLETFPLSQPAVEVVQRVTEGRKEGYVFINPENGKPFARSGINAFYRHVRILGLKAKDGSPLRFHDLRHVYATTLRDMGISLDDLRVLLGHKDRSTTDRYVTYDRKAVGECLTGLKRLRK
ncbi:tyrosine-type recombinase/integrase [bacterium]|nr:tyrosine-type recombinase/integrase [bacterium]